MTPPAKDQLVTSIIKGGPLMVALMVVLCGVWWEVDKLREGYQANTITVREATAENLSMLAKSVDLLSLAVSGTQVQVASNAKLIEQTINNGTRIITLMEAAEAMMRPVAQQRVEQNQLLREIKEELQKK
jgi:hypothetical protein